jgi:hypothetical protein
MALKSRNSFWQQLHLLARLVGVTGLAVALCGCFIWGVLGQSSFGPYFVGELSIGHYTGKEIGLIVLYVSAGAVGLALLFEVRGLTKAVASHRGLFGINVLLQIALALALVIGANVYSFEHFRRFDLTRNQIFTLDDDIRNQLRELRGETEIIVVQNYVSFGQGAANKQDKYDYAAQRKIVEKVKDLAEAFQDLGPRFRVRILDIQDDNYDKKLEEIRTGISKNKDVAKKKQVGEQLAKAIENAPENSVFVFSKEKDRFQRISFSDIYQLDKRGSVENKNLVLKDQGAGPLAGKISNIEEKTPRIAAAVIHPVLGFQDDSQPRYTMAGGKKILDAYGFDCLDIALRRLNDDGSLGDPTVLTHDESQYEDIQDDLAFLADEIKDMQKEFDEFTELHKFWAESSLAEVNKKYAFVVLPDDRVFMTLRSSVEKNKKSLGQAKVVGVDEEKRLRMVAQSKSIVDRLKHALDSSREEQSQLIEKKGKLQVDSLAEKRRITDLETKANAMLANVDLLIVPRLTAVSIPQGEVYTNRIHRLEAGQFKAVKAFLKQGKPVLFLLGPANDPRPTPDFGGGGPDALEPMLGELGFYLPKQIILYDAEKREFNERKFSEFSFGKSKHSAELPPLRFDETTSSYTWGKSSEPFKVHPIRTSMRLMNRAMISGDAEIAKDKDKKDAKKPSDAAVIRVRHPRPVYFMRTTPPPESAASIVGALGTNWLKKAQQKPDEDGVFLVTSKECWNEENPFIVQGKVPRFAPTEDDDPKKGTADEERHGPFPIGVAVETQVPASWFDKDSAKAPKVRVAVIGSGGAFVGPTLSPLKEKLFLDTVNWLLGRDDLLAKDSETWEYPRVELTPLELNCWYAVSYGLPVLFIYMGMVVWLVRRMR